MIAALICAALVLLICCSNRPDELQSHIGQTKALINRKGSRLSQNHQPETEH